MEFKYKIISGFMRFLLPIVPTYLTKKKSISFCNIVSDKNLLTAVWKSFLSYNNL